MDNKMLSIPYLAERIRSWAEARNIVKGATRKDQFAKLMSEFGELGENIFFNIDKDHHGEEVDWANVRDDIGDNFVVLTILAAQSGHSIEDLGMADTFPSMDHIAHGEFLLLSRVYGRLGDAILKGDEPEVETQLKMACLLLPKLAERYNQQIEQCIAEAYKDIKDRRGVMYHGAFVKSTDARYEACCRELGLEP